MKILFVSALGEGAGLAISCQNEGHEVLWYVHDPKERAVGRGILKSVPDWLSVVNGVDFVVFDDVKQPIDQMPDYLGGTWAAAMRRRGIPCVGGSPTTDRLENDRVFGQKVAEQGKTLDIAPMRRFTGAGAWKQARQFAEGVGGGFALKHNSQAPRDLGTVAWDPADLGGFMDWLESGAWERYTHGAPVDFVLQEARKGVEIAVTGIFDGQRWRGAYVNQEVKKLMSGDEGPATGQMGEMGLLDPGGKVFKAALEPLTEFLAREKYHGCIDLNCIATKDSLVPLEWTSRFGYPTVWSLVELLNVPVADWLAAMASGEGPIRWHHAFNCNVVVGSGPFPVEDPKRARHIRIVDYEPSPHLHLCEVQKVNGHLESAGSMGYLAVATYHAATPTVAAQRAHEEARNLHVLPYRIIRDDIGEKWAKDYPKLQKWGWLP